MPHTQGNNNSCDCGTFFLDVVGRYAPGEVVLLPSPRARESDPKIEEAIERTWQEQMARAQREGRRLFDGRLARLVCYEPLPHRLELTLGQTTYREFLGTNLYNAALRYTYGGDVLGDPLGVSAAILTADNYILLGLRSETVAFHAGRVHPVGGMLELTADGTPTEPFQAVLDEIEQETGLQRTDLISPLCLGIVRDRKIVQPELVFWLRASAAASDVRARWPHAHDAHEHTDFVAIRSDATSVIEFIQNRHDDLTPLALATLLLHGQHTWGSGWFTAARGYLRKVV
ncbi:MAG: hypothetical protein FWE88_00390 [Phycisphaerae bacterium]|nr:hypothetical protein [Phycisphaerae bacterium]